MARDNLRPLRVASQFLREFLSDIQNLLITKTKVFSEIRFLDDLGPLGA
jgi:hypothetical protein